MKVSAVKIWNVAGYTSLAWDRIQPDLNFLLGRNGAGKTTILQALSFGLNLLAGTRTEDLLTRTYPDGGIEITLKGRPEPIHLPFGKIRVSQGSPGEEYSLDVRVLQFVENRQPKNTVGDVRNEFRQHPTRRYMNAISELKYLLESNEADQRFAAEVLAICKRITATGASEGWEWIRDSLIERGPLRARPLSCGQFDIAALSLDLVRLKHSLRNEPAPVFVLVDNPETYLHPACQEPVLELIGEMLPEAQLFVASHSLKLLCHREPKAVFWLSRESQDERGNVVIQSIRELPSGAKKLFYELYGDDLSSAVLRLLSAFESPEYYKFLSECASPGGLELRDKPAEDRQMLALRKQIGGLQEKWTVFDYGAGHGDLLVALLGWGETNPSTVYVAMTKDESIYLRARIEQAVKDFRISSASMLVHNLADAPSDCDVIVLCNVCHEISLPYLPVRLSKLLTHHMRPVPWSRIVIHEVETLPAGESHFVMWTPVDFQKIFGWIDGLQIQTERVDFSGVPLETTIIYRHQWNGEADNLEERLTQAFYEILPSKRESSLSEIERLKNLHIPGKGGLEEALRQRRLAFLVAQVTNICLLERQKL